MARPELERLQTEVSENKTVIGSAVTLINGFKSRLQAVKDELAAKGIENETLNALSDDLDTSGNDLANAVANNTPAEGQV